MTVTGDSESENAQQKQSQQYVRHTGKGNEQKGRFGPRPVYLAGATQQCARLAVLFCKLSIIVHLMPGWTALTQSRTAIFPVAQPAATTRARCYAHGYHRHATLAGWRSTQL